MEILNLGGAEEENIPPRLKSRKKTKLKVAVGIGSLAAITGLGSTLAASITLNNDTPVEFGQGVATTAACDNNGITITPSSEYVPSSESFRLDTVQLSGINLGTPDQYTGIGCAGKTLIIRAYTDSNSGYSSFAVGGDSANPLYLTHITDYYSDGTSSEHLNDGIAIRFDANGDIDDVFVSTSNGWDSADINYAPGGSAGSVDIYFGNTERTGYYGDTYLSSANFGLDSRAVSKFTVESLDEIDTSYDWYDVGLVPS